MNKNLLIGVVVVALIAAGAFYFMRGDNAPTDNTPVATSTPDTASPSEPVTPSSQEASAPSVTTSNSAVPANTTVVVSGKVTPNGAQTSYWYEYGKTTGLGTNTNAQTIGSGFIAINAPAYITGLSPNTLYYFRLSAKNSFGTVNGSTYSFTTNSNPPPAGSAPDAQTTQATNVSRTAATLNGRVDPNGADTSYWFEYGESTNLGATTAFRSAGSGNSAVDASVSLSGLKPQTKYYFRLNGQNQFGTVNGAVLSFTTDGPAISSAPTVDTTAATAVTSSGATLNGQLNPNGEATTYWFEYSRDSLLGSILGSTTRNQSAGGGTSDKDVSATVNGLSADTSYFYRLVAENSRGTVRGDIVTFRTRP